MLEERNLVKKQENTPKKETGETKEANIEQKKNSLTKTSCTIRRSARLNKSTKESSWQYVEFFNLEEDEELKIPFPIVPSPVSSPIAKEWEEH